SSTSSSTYSPGTSVRKTSLLAPSPSASAADASSALTFSGPTASGATTGTLPAASAARSFFGRHGNGSPTCPSGGTGTASSPSRWPSTGTATSPSAAHSPALTASIDSRTTSTAARD